MQSTDSRFADRVLAAPDIVLGALVIVYTTIVAGRTMTIEVTGHTLKGCLEGKTIPAGFCQQASVIVVVQLTVRRHLQLHLVGRLSVSAIWCNLRSGS